MTPKPPPNGTEAELAADTPATAIAGRDARAETLPAALGAVGGAGAVTLGGVALTAAGDGSFADIGAVLALLGLVAAVLAGRYVLVARDLPRGVRAAYIVLLIGLVLGTGGAVLAHDERPPERQCDSALTPYAQQSCEGRRP